MRNIFVTVMMVLVTMSSVQVSPVYAKGSHKPKPTDKKITGTVKVTRSENKVISVEFKATDATVYLVKLDKNGEALAKDYDGKSVTVKAKLGMIDGKKEIIVEEIIGLK